MKWRRIILSRYLFLIPIGVAGWIALSCLTIQTAAFYTGLAGLLFDLSGAILAVAPDTKLSSHLERPNKQVRLDNLRATRTLVAQGGQIKEGRDDPEFGELLSIVQAHRNFTETPDDFITVGAANGTWLAAAKSKKQVEVVDRDNAATAKNHVARLTDVDRWLQEEIESLEREDKQPIRRRGLEILAIGFSFQIAGYLLWNSNWIRDLLIELSYC